MSKSRRRLLALSAIAALLAFLLILGIGGILIHRAYSHDEDKIAEDDNTPKKPRFTISKETTYFTGPLDKEGYIDYEAAINERLGQGIKPESNAAVLLVSALGPVHFGHKLPPRFYKMLGIPEPAEKGDYFRDLDQYAKEVLHLEAGDSKGLENEREHAIKRIWTPDRFPRIAAWLKANEKPLALLIEANHRKDYFLPIVTTWDDDRRGDLLGAPSPFAQSSRDLARALATRAVMRAGMGGFDAARQDLLACYRLGRLLGRGPTLIDCLVGVVICKLATDASLTVLESPGLTSKQISLCLRELHELPPLELKTGNYLLYSRCEFLDHIMWINRMGIPYLEGLSAKGRPTPPTELQKHFLDDANFDPALRRGNRWYDRLAVAMNETDHHARSKQLAAIENDIDSLKKKLLNADLIKLIGNETEKGELVGDLLACLVLPKPTTLQRSFDRAEQRYRNLIVAFALAAHQRDNGKYPPTLAALAPKYLAKIPDDLFTGKPLAYRPTETGYLLYSLGPDGKDDAGRGLDDDPKGDDIAVRMPLPKLIEAKKE